MQSRVPLEIIGSHMFLTVCSRYSFPLPHLISIKVKRRENASFLNLLVVFFDFQVPRLEHYLELCLLLDTL